MWELGARATWMRLVVVASLAAGTLGVGLGHTGSGHLTYHEAFVAQAAREMLASGDAFIPTLGGQPWLEKPPLAIWLVALLGRVAGGVDEGTARLPSALAAVLVALGVSLLAGRRFGPIVGLLAGLVQVTTAWTVLRGRLAEADLLLACLVTWTLVAYDHLRTSQASGAESLTGGEARVEHGSDASKAAREPFSSCGAWWRWLFFVGLGLTALAKGIGFGAALVLAVVVMDLVWNLDLDAFRRLKFTQGWVLALVLALAWPVLAALRHPSALGLWLFHVSDRLAANPEHFTGSRSWWFYGPAVLGQLLPWTPLVLLGAFRSLPWALARSGRAGGDRFLWTWAVAPVVLLSLATVKSPHYAIHALPPCSIWSALGLVRLGEQLQARRGWSLIQVKRVAWATFVGLGIVYAAGFTVIGPWLDRRGRAVEWAFYEDVSRRLAPGQPVALLYHVPEWDRAPYVTPFGPVPHDWGVRLFYLKRPAPCRFSIDDLAKSPPSGSSFAVIGRASDLPGLSELGRVETLAQGPTLRASSSKVDDRTYRLYRVTRDALAVANGRAVGPLR